MSSAITTTVTVLDNSCQLRTGLGLSLALKTHNLLVRYSYSLNIITVATKPHWMLHHIVCTTVTVV